MILVVLLGKHMLSVLYLVPMSILGVLLLFAGGQLALTIIDLKDRKELFVTLAMLGITLASNLAAGFIAGLIIAYLLKSKRMNI
jgi:SulP family sulfate permease